LETTAASDDGSTTQTPVSASVWEHCRRLAVEVFVAEPLTRVWTALLVASDRRRAQQLAEPIGRSVFIGHLEARRLCLQAMVDAPDAVLHEVVELDRLRRRVERWTDVLLSPLAATYPVGEFAFSTERAREFAIETSRAEWRAAVRRLVSAGIQLSFSEGGLHIPVLSEDHLAVAVSVLSCFPSDAVEQTGELKSLRLLRLYRNFRLSDQQVSPQSPAARLAKAADRLSDSLWRGPFDLPETGGPRPGISFRRLRDRFRDN